MDNIKKRRARYFSEIPNPSIVISAHPHALMTEEEIESQYLERLALPSFAEEAYKARIRNLQRRSASVTPSELCKQHGTTLAEMVRVTEQSQQTLINWFNNPKKRKLFEVTCKGVAAEMKEKGSE